MASRVCLSAPYHEAAEPERPPPALTNDLLEEILVRVASPADLARASTACVAFHRLITNHSFLRRYRSIHPPLLLGFVSSSGFHPAQAPHPSASVARIVAQAADFSYDYLPRSTAWNNWSPRDVRNGRVLVVCGSEKDGVYWNLAVCDPLSRRYVLLPPITDNLLASVKLQKQNVSHFHPRAFFIPSGGTEEDTSFSVILWMQSNKRLGVFVFSSVSGCWSVGMSTNCDVLGLRKFGALLSGQCAYDCFYWRLCNRSTLIKLDMNTMQFCTVHLPSGHDGRPIVIVESGRNKVAMFSLNYEDRSVDYYTFSQNGSEELHEWHMISSIPLPANYGFNIWSKSPAEGYIFLEGFHGEWVTHSKLFSLEIKSFKIQYSKLCQSSPSIFRFPTIYVTSKNSRIWRGIGSHPDLEHWRLGADAFFCISPWVFLFPMAGVLK